LIRQLVNEALLLTVGGGVTGLLFSIALTASLNHAYYSVDVEGHPLYFNFNLEQGVVIGSLGIMCGVGLLLGLIPALHVFRSGLADGMKKESGSVSATARPARWLVCAQTAVAVALVSLAGLLTMSAREFISGTNFDSSHVALMRLRPRLM